MKAFFEQIKPFLPVLYIALGIAVGALGMKSCTPDHKVETVVTTRTVTIPGPSDTAFVEVRIPVRVPVPYALPPAAQPLDSATLAYIEFLWSEIDRRQARIDSLEGIVATAVTETPSATLRAHLDMPVFLRNPKQGLWAEAEIRGSDTTRTFTESCELTFWRRFGIGLYGGLGYDIMNNTVGAQVGVGGTFRIY